VLGVEDDNQDLHRERDEVRLDRVECEAGEERARGEGNGVVDGAGAKDEEPVELEGGHEFREGAVRVRGSSATAHCKTC